VIKVDVDDSIHLDETLRNPVLLHNVVEAAFDRQVRLANRAAREENLDKKRAEFIERRRSGVVDALDAASIQALAERNRLRRASYSCSSTPSPSFSDHSRSGSVRASRRGSEPAAVATTKGDTGQDPVAGPPVDVTPERRRATYPSASRRKARRQSQLSSVPEVKVCGTWTVDLDRHGGKKYGFSASGAGASAGGTGIVISGVTEGGQAQATGKIAVGDHILMVGGAKAALLTKDDLSRLIAQSSKLRLTIKRLPSVRKVSRSTAASPHTGLSTVPSSRASSPTRKRRDSLSRGEGSTTPDTATKSHRKASQRSGLHAPRRSGSSIRHSQSLDKSGLQRSASMGTKKESSTRAGRGSFMAGSTEPVKIRRKSMKAGVTEQLPTPALSDDCENAAPPTARVPGKSVRFAVSETNALRISPFANLSEESSTDAAPSRLTLAAASLNDETSTDCDSVCSKEAALAKLEAACVIEPPTLRTRRPTAEGGVVARLSAMFDQHLADVTAC